MDKEMYDFEESLRRQERARTTIEKYSRQVRRFLGFLGGREISKELVLAYRQSLLDAGRRPRSVNSDLSAIHSYLRSIGRQDCVVQMLRVQRSAFISEERQLGEEEYRRLLAAAGDRKNRRLKLVMETICSTGIRVSELRYVTVEAVRSGRAEICLKGKSRTILLPRALRNPLLAYARECGIGEGCIFRTRSGKPLDRSKPDNNLFGNIYTPDPENGSITPTGVADHWPKYLAGSAVLFAVSGVLATRLRRREETLEDVVLTEDDKHDAP